MERRGRSRGRGKVAVVVEKRAWVGWQPDGDATVSLRTDLQMPREAEQVSELLRRQLREGRLCPGTSLFQPKEHTGLVCCFLSTFQ